MDRRFRAAVPLLALWVIGLLAAAPESRGEFYRYVDENGTVHFVDDLSHVPSEYHPSVKTYEEDGTARNTGEGAPLPGTAAPGSDGSGGVSDDPGGLESAVRIAGNQILVPAVLGFKGRELEVTFLLDTGATVTTLHKESVAPLRLYGGIPSRMQVVGGRTLPSRMVQFDFIRVGPMTVENVYASVLEHRGNAVGYDGLLGMNFLRFADYSIDFDRQVIRWRPKGQPGS